MAPKPIEIRTDESPEAWGEFLRQLEERCRLAASDPGRLAREDREECWRTENGDPIDPIAFFVAFTGLE